MPGLNHRVHVLLDDERMTRLRERAAASRTSVGAVIRTALDRELESGPDPAAIAALESFLAAPPIPVGTPEELERELEEMWDREID